ncbi:unnamed protein product [Medioppia subpectinata]|uniref:Uncharacterized protein n=1 Tax=Medioppia subpectinata TaxID=1979941 RepID=A0A7R9KR21_9ACAR|nr:unnamed protein product [Medioppia subpectinata]CAG2107964.1 unnamed protein product [Medioppia subpectinata]
MSVFSYREIPIFTKTSSKNYYHNNHHYNHHNYGRTRAKITMSIVLFLSDNCLGNFLDENNDNRLYETKGNVIKNLEFDAMSDAVVEELPQQQRRLWPRPVPPVEDNRIILYLNSNCLGNLLDENNDNELFVTKRGVIKDLELNALSGQLEDQKCFFFIRRFIRRRGIRRRRRRRRTTTPATTTAAPEGAPARRKKKQKRPTKASTTKKETEKDYIPTDTSDSEYITIRTKRPDNDSNEDDVFVESDRHRLTLPAGEDVVDYNELCVLIVLCALLVVSTVCYGAAIQSDVVPEGDLGVNEIQKDQECGGGGGGTGGDGGTDGGTGGGTQNSQGRRGGRGGSGGSGGRAKNN